MRRILGITGAVVWLVGCSGTKAPVAGTLGATATSGTTGGVAGTVGSSSTGGFSATATSTGSTGTSSSSSASSSTGTSGTSGSSSTSSTSSSTGSTGSTGAVCTTSHSRGCSGASCTCTWSLEESPDHLIADHVQFHDCAATVDTQGHVTARLDDGAGHSIDFASVLWGSSCAVPEADGTPWINVWDGSTVAFFTVQGDASQNCNVGDLGGGSLPTYDACDNEHASLQVQFAGTMSPDGGPALTYHLGGGYVVLTY